MSAMPTVVELQALKQKKFYADAETLADLQVLEKHFNCKNFSQLMRTVIRTAKRNLTES